MDFWGLFYLFAVAGTYVYGHWPSRPRCGHQHVWGADLIAISWVASNAARFATHDATPLELYAAIDVAMCFAFLGIAASNRAIWAAVCVALHGAMTALHLARFLAPGPAAVIDNGYIWLLNSLFFLSLLTINVAIAAGRHEWGSVVDHLFVARARGWTWSGVDRARGEAHS